MAIETREKLEVGAPVDAVWAFVIDPRQVAPCVPGAKLEEVVDERTFVGSVTIKIGAITTSYRGRVRLERVDEADHAVELVAEGRETGGGLARGSMSSRLRALPDGRTEVIAEATVDLTGRVMQMGRGMIQGVAHQLFQQFAARLKQRLEAPPAASAPAASGEGAATVGAGSATTAGASGAPEPSEAGAIRIVPILLLALRAAIARFFRRLFGRPTPTA